MNDGDSQEVYNTSEGAVYDHVVCKHIPRWQELTREF